MAPVCNQDSSSLTWYGFYCSVCVSGCVLSPLSPGSPSVFYLRQLSTSRTVWWFGAVYVCKHAGLLKGGCGNYLGLMSEMNSMLFLIVVGLFDFLHVHFLFNNNKLMVNYFSLFIFFLKSFTIY